MESSWIGLTRENPDPIGFWIWTQPGDISTSYSNWELGKPDNKYGRQEYAVILNSTGQWTDVTKEETRPAVCKKYQKTCPSIDEFFEGDVRVRGWESTGAEYQVGEVVEVYCRWPSSEVQPRSVTCGIDGSFSPAMDCPSVENSNIHKASAAGEMKNLYYKLEMNVVEVVHERRSGSSLGGIYATDCSFIKYFVCTKLQSYASPHSYKFSCHGNHVFDGKGGEKNHPAKPGRLSKSPYLRRTQWVR
eukprot:sb/3468885/